MVRITLCINLSVHREKFFFRHKSEKDAVRRIGYINVYFFNYERFLVFIRKIFEQQGINRVIVAITAIDQIRSYSHFFVCFTLLFVVPYSPGHARKSKNSADKRGIYAHYGAEKSIVGRFSFRGGNPGKAVNQHRAYADTHKHDYYYTYYLY